MEKPLENQLSWDRWFRDSQKANQFEFKVPQRSDRRRIGIKISECPFVQVKNVRHRKGWLRRALDQFHGVRCQANSWVLGAQTGKRLQKRCVLQKVKVARARRLELDFAEVEQVEHARQPAFGFESAFCHRFDPAVTAGEPGDDEA